MRSLAGIARESSGGSGLGDAPSNAPYVTTASDATLTNEQVLGTTIIIRDLAANIPAASIAGRLFIESDGRQIIYRDTGLAWVEIARGFVTPKLVAPPTSLLALVSATVWPAANRALFHRFSVPQGGTYRYINWRCDVQAGNVQVGVVPLSGTGYTTYGAPIMDSTVIACPAAGDIQTDIGATILPAGEYALFMWASSATFQCRNASNSGLVSARIAGFVSSLGSGITAGGTLAWSSGFVGYMTLEAA